jgi:hypothetical protein
VSRRWRSLVFQSPRRLNLRLVCAPNTPARVTLLDIWPVLPLIVEGSMDVSRDTDTVIAALAQSNRICQVRLFGLQDWELEEVLAPMQVSFPELTDLELSSHGGMLAVIPDSFLAGSAPRLQDFELSNISFPGLPKLLLSATHLVELGFWNIPHSGYISPEAMVASLSVLSSLEQLFLDFQSPESRPDMEGRSLPPPKRSVLPALDKFHFKGVTEYLEDLVTFIDAPRLNYFYIIFFTQTVFDTPRLAQFINRTPTLRARDKVQLQFGDGRTSVALPAPARFFRIRILCREPDLQLSSIVQVCNSSLPPSCTVEDLCIEREFGCSEVVWKNDAIENALWLRLLLPFTEVANLYLSKEFAPAIAAALQELSGDRITEVMPSLQSIFVEGLEPSGPFQENTGQFVIARRLSGHPITISVWDTGRM